MAIIEVPVFLSAFGAEPVPGTAVVAEQDPGERLVRALAGLGMFWGLALLGLFIPVAHFILVPTFLTAGFVVAVKRAREDNRLIAVRGACPRCSVEQEFKVGGRLTADRTFDCPNCHDQLLLAVGRKRGNPA